jgi:hypothetical protein
VDALDLDTSPEAKRRYFDLLRSRTPAERLRIVDAANHRVRLMLEAGIRRRHPEATDDDVRAEVRRIRYGTATSTVSKTAS